MCEWLRRGPGVIRSHPRIATRLGRKEVSGCTGLFCQGLSAMSCLCPCMPNRSPEASNLLEDPPSASASQRVSEEDKLLGEKPASGCVGVSVTANAMHRGAWLDENDDLASQCFICNVEFGMLMDSRHHCRRCGNTFCAKCSTGRAPLLLYGVKTPERLCDACYPQAQTDNEFATRHLPRLTRGTTCTTKASAFSFSAETVLVRLTTKGDAIVVLGKEANPIATVSVELKESTTVQFEVVRTGSAMGGV